ncbi:uncharacterized protein LOC108907688 [Anoplophora glabripennis]|uniref:uncharacterized protein LOC108907688 n=1 Tax=Anoplophora glabripennis TaxID=217634 RepID=UPI000C76CE60|nr:uncharacterized protein LOC108907688 [Anoplophora glabripennis]
MSDEHVRNFHVMPDFSKTIEDFTGESGPQDAKLWLKQLETTANLHSWPQAFVFETARSHLCGAAKFWYRGRNDITDWTKFKTAFANTFLMSKSKTELWKEMQSRIQGIKENVSVYFHEKITLCRELNLDFEETKEQVVIGLWSKELANFLITKVHKDENELFKDILHYERIKSARVERVHERNSKINNESSVPDTMKEYVNKKNLRPPLKNEKGEMKCYNCDEYGHIAKQCQKEKRVYTCLRCNEEGHIVRHCTKPKPMERGEVKLINNGLTNSMAKYIKTVTLDGVDYIAMIDPGSSDCTIKATPAISGSFQINKEECDFKGFGNVANLVKLC